MSNEHDQTKDSMHAISADPYREQMWNVISESWDAQVSRRRRRQVVRMRAAAGFGLAATLLVGVLVGRWSIQTESIVAPAPLANSQAALSPARQIALEQHLRDAETLLVLFEAAGEPEAALAGRARELAAASHMLVAFDVARDAELESLLQDLELLLLQIARVTAAGDAAELDITLAGIREVDAIARMRAMRSQDSRLNEI